MSDELDLPVPDELTSLKARADLLGITYHPSIGLEKLRDKVNAAVTSTGADVENEAKPQLNENEERAAVQRKAVELVRIRVTCMNPAKKEWEGEIFTTGNSVVGTIKKFVPFNVDEGWHVPRMILEMLQQRECQVFTTVRDGRGNTTRRGKIIKEFAVEVLPPLTEAELKELAQRQAMSGSVA